jgi:UDP-glucose 4-epimerase
MSTTTLLNKVAVSLGKPARLFPVPVSLLQGGARLLGQQAAVQRLCGSLQVDISKAKQLLGWTPPITVDEGLRRAVSTELF